MRGDIRKDQVQEEGVTGITEIILITKVIEIIIMTKIIVNILRAVVRIACMRDLEVTGDDRLLALR